MGKKEFVAFSINIEEDWRTSIMHYLLYRELLLNKNKVIRWLGM
jgi:hypothetical protein